jgi:hypothetical protein
MRILNKDFLLKAIAEIAIVVIGVTIAFWVEQYRDKLNNQQRLISMLSDIDRSLKDDSILIAKYGYEDINLTINQIDSSVNLLIRHKTLNLSGDYSPLYQALTDYNDGNLNAFIKSETFNSLDLPDLKRRMTDYSIITNEMWDKEQRLLDYIQNQVTPTIHSVGEMYIQTKSINDGPLIENHLVKAINDLRYIRKEYLDKKERLWPFVIDQNYELRIAIRDELNRLK